MWRSVYFKKKMHWQSTLLFYVFEPFVFVYFIFGNKTNSLKRVVCIFMDLCVSRKILIRNFLRKEVRLLTMLLLGIFHDRPFAEERNLIDINLYDVTLTVSWPFPAGVIGLTDQLINMVVYPL